MCIPAAQAGAKSISRFRRKFAAMEVAQIHFGGEDLPLADCKPTLYSVNIMISVNIIHNVAQSCQKSEPGSSSIFLMECQLSLKALEEFCRYICCWCWLDIVQWTDAVLEKATTFETESGRVRFQKKGRVAGQVWVPVGHWS